MQDRSERVDIGAGVEPVDLTARLLGRHVGRGADQRALRRLVAVAGPAGQGRRFGIRFRDPLGHAPVHHQRLAERADHDVCRLEIPVDEPLRVGERHGSAHLLEEPQKGGSRKTPFAPFVQTLPAHQFHRVEDPAVRQPADVVHRHDVRMLEPRQVSRLLHQPGREHTGRVGQTQHLEGELPVEVRVAHEVDGSHSPAGERRTSRYRVPDRSGWSAMSRRCPTTSSRSIVNPGRRRGGTAPRAGTRRR